MSHQAAQTTPVQDISGYTVFSAGDVGAAHVMAHRMLDENQIELGHQLLSEFLDTHSGSGSDWVHLHFHMAIFELELNNWSAAYTRFMNEVLPTAATTELALTDAPALLWRLVMTAPEPVEFPWEALRMTALGRMQSESEPFVELHNLLALAGAGDAANIDRWLKARPDEQSSRRYNLVREMAVALRAYAVGSYEFAAAVLRRTVPELPEVGGSRAQNQLFGQIEETCRLAAGT
jgi:hypothetical protein